MRALLQGAAFQLALLGLAVGLGAASSKGGAGAGGASGGAIGAGPLRPEKDPSLNHPALRLVNRSEEVLILRLEGPVRRDVVAPPGEHIRTLVAAGTYRFEVRRGEKLVRRGAVALRRGHRYHLELAP